MGKITDVMKKIGIFTNKNANTHKKGQSESSKHHVYNLTFVKEDDGVWYIDLPNWKGPDYRKELTQIYHKLMNYRTSESMQKSIEDVTDPTKNSINEKCARIRHAFATHMGNFMAHYYAITGNRGETKRILLDREYIRFGWEAMPLANGQESQT